MVGMRVQHDIHESFAANGFSAVDANTAPLESHKSSLLDDTNKAIIRELQKSGRKPYGAIGKVVGLSEAAVRGRVQRLVEAGIIQIVAVTDPIQLGYRRQALIGVNTTGDLDAIAARLRETDGIDYIVAAAGRFDMLLEGFTADDDELLDLVMRIRKIPGVDHTEVFTYLRLIEQRYDFGVG